MTGLLAVSRRPYQTSANPGRLTLDDFAPTLAYHPKTFVHFRRAAPDLDVAPRTRPASEPDGIRGCSRFRDDLDRPAANPGRLILGPLARACAPFSSTFVHFGRVFLYLDLMSRTRTSGEPCDRAGVSGFREAPDRPTGNPGRLILGPPHTARAWFSHAPNAPPLISLSHQELSPRPNPTTGRNSRDFANVLTNMPPVRAA